MTSQSGGGPAPKVSVVMPAFNGARYIREAMESVASQTFRDLELIVVDDGSTDDTAAIVSAFASANPGCRTRCLRQKNRGAAFARNAGVAASLGEYVAFLDCDDVWLPHKLEAQVPALEADPGAALVFGDAVSFGEGAGEPVTASKTYGLPGANTGLHALFCANYVPTLTVIVRRSDFEKYGRFDESISIVEDYDLWLRAAAAGRLIYVDSLVAKYRVHPGNISRITPEKEEKLLLDMIKARGGALERDPALAAALPPGSLRRCYYKLFLNLATFYLKRGERRRSREMTARYLSLCPYNPAAYLVLLLSFLPSWIGGLVWRS